MRDITLFIVCDENLDPLHDPQSDYDIALDLCLNTENATHIMVAEYRFNRYIQPPEVHRREENA